MLKQTLADTQRRAALHVLNRLGFGPRPGDVARVLDRGLERYILEQLDPPADPDLEARLAPLTSLRYSIGQILDTAANWRSYIDEFYTAKLVRAAHSRNQLQELLVDFWFNHFNITLLDEFQRFSTMPYERDAIRPHVFGRFRDLLGATASHPAMLFYLDNYLSTVSSVDPRTGQPLKGLNENYGRELLELHTVGVDAGYTQADVFDAARCFTGWTIDGLRTGGSFVFRPEEHDTGAKQVFGLRIPAGGGRDDGDKLLDHLAQHPATARHVSRRLVERFVSDDPPQRLVDRCAGRFLATGGDLREVIRTIVGSPEFWAEAFGAGKPKSPLELVVSSLRAVEAEVTGSRRLVEVLVEMGMSPYQCLPPTGYSNRGADWLNPSSHLSRMNFALELAANGVAGVAVDVPAAVRRAGGDPGDPLSVARVMSGVVFAGALSAPTAAAAARVSPGVRVSTAAKVVGLCLAGPEFQSR